MLALSFPEWYCGVLHSFTVPHRVLPGSVRIRRSTECSKCVPWLWEKSVVALSWGVVLDVTILNPQALKPLHGSTDCFPLAVGSARSDLGGKRMFSSSRAAVAVGGVAVAVAAAAVGVASAVLGEVAVGVVVVVIVVAVAVVGASRK